jgi:hypothetical protein
MSFGLIHRCTVYTQGASGRHDTLAKADLACRFVPLGGGQSIQDRASLAASRKLLFDPSYEMPTDSQIERDGERWNPQVDTYLARESPLGGLHHRSVLLVRAPDDDL